MEVKDGFPWMTLALDPVEQVVYVAGYAMTEQETAFHMTRHECPYQKAFYMGLDAGTLARNLLQWLKACGVPTSEAKETIREVGRTIGREMRELAKENGWDK